jgi:hypothetical protein
MAFLLLRILLSLKAPKSKLQAKNERLLTFLISYENKVTFGFGLMEKFIAPMSHLLLRNSLLLFLLFKIGFKLIVTLRAVLQNR